MSLALLILQDEHLLGSFQRALESRYGYRTVACRFPSKPELSQSPAWVADSFTKLCDWIDSQQATNSQDASLNGALAIIDLWDEDCDGLLGVQPLEEHQQPATALAGLLVLAYPEIHWVFNTPDADTPGDGESEKWFREAHLLSSASDPLLRLTKLHDKGFVPLFDPTGLRRHLRNAVWQKMSANPDSWDKEEWPDRKSLAVSIDEEVNFAWFNALAAFRLGYRVQTITTWEGCRAWLSSEDQAIDLVFQDLYLNFADRPGDFLAVNSAFEEGWRHLSYLPFLDEQCSALKNVGYRVLVTVGHHRGGVHRSIWKQDKGYRRARPGRTALVYKPVAGLYALLRSADLWDRRKSQPAFPRTFHWPPDTRHSASDENLHHGSPGRILLVATRLLSRATSILQNCQRVQDAVCAAVLAIESKELLGGRTPTVSLEAIALQHHAEVVAESLFMGVEYNLALADRFAEIRSEVEATASWFHPSRFARSAVNARLFIVEMLASCFRDLNQLEEERECLAEARGLHFRFFTLTRPWLIVFWPILAYTAFVLRSLPRFLFAVFAWIVFFSIVYYVIPITPRPKDVIDCVEASTYFMFAQQLPQSWQITKDHGLWSEAWEFILAFQSGVCYSSLGVLVSHLYMIVSRR